MMNAPCKGCPDREVGCHGKCPKYQEYRKRLDEVNKEKQEEKNITWALNEKASAEYRKKLNRYKRDH